MIILIIDITNYIPVGAKNAVHLTDLANLLGCSTSFVKKMVRNARVSGDDICSGVEGYWKPEENAELLKYIRTQEKQARTRFFVSGKVKSRHAGIAGQLELELIER